MSPWEEIALVEHCPECGATPGNWCAYILSPVPVEGYSHVQYQLNRVGKRTKRLHNGRFHLAWVTERKVKRAKELAMLQEFFARFGDIFCVDAD